MCSSLYPFFTVSSCLSDDTTLAFHWPTLRGQGQDDLSRPGPRFSIQRRANILSRCGGDPWLARLRATPCAS
jgi:hypothetical protein